MPASRWLFPIWNLWLEHGPCVGTLNGTTSIQTDKRWWTGHILREVYNCRERKNFQPANTLKFPVKKIYRFLKISDSFFFSNFLYFYVSALPNAAGTTAQPTFCVIHSQNFTFFTILFYAFPLFQLKIYNYNCTIPILQLQTTFYNCTNCHQLHVKICPGDERSHHNRVTIYNLNTFRPTFINWHVYLKTITIATLARLDVVLLAGCSTVRGVAHTAGILEQSSPMNLFSAAWFWHLKMTASWARTQQFG